MMLRCVAVGGVVAQADLGIVDATAASFRDRVRRPPDLTESTRSPKSRARWSTMSTANFPTVEDHADLRTLLLHKKDPNLRTNAAHEGHKAALTQLLDEVDASRPVPYQASVPVGPDGLHPIKRML